MGDDFIAKAGAKSKIYTSYVNSEHDFAYKLQLKLSTNQERRSTYFCHHIFQFELSVLCLRERESDVRAVFISCLEINDWVSVNPVYLVVGVRNTYVYIAPYALPCVVFDVGMMC